MVYHLIVFPLASSFRLFLPAYARLLIMLSFANLLLDTSLCAIPLETTQSTVQSLILFYDYI